MTRYVAATLPPLVDVAVFSVLVFRGWPLRSSHIASFGVAIALNYLLKVRSTVVAQKRSGDWRLHGQLLIVALLALALRGGVLAEASLVWGWGAPASIVLAVIAGLAVTVPGQSYVLSSAGGAARGRTLAIGLIVYAFALRLAYLGSVDLLPEEAYYWNYSRHPDFAYLDHPPLVAWLIKLGTAAWGGTQFGVRLGALCCAAVAAGFTYRLTRNLFGEASALGAVVLAQTLPFFFLAGFLVTPDAPLTAAWAATVFYLERALVGRSPRAWWGAGIALGVGLMSKYSIGLLVPVIIGFMLVDRPSRAWWRRPEPYLALLIALAIFSPVIVWNAQHDWASFAFQTSRRLAEAPRFSLHKLIASILVLITPTGAFAVSAAFLGTKPGHPGGDPRRWLFMGMALLLPLTVFALFSVRHEVKLDWTGAPWIAAIPLMAAGMTQGAPGGMSSRIRGAWMPTLLTLLLLYGAGLHYLALGLPGVGYGKHIELIPVGWRDFSRQVEDKAAQVRSDTGTAPLVVGMDRYAIASELAFYSAMRADSALETSSAHLFGGVGLMYERWSPAELQAGRTLLLVAWDPRDLTGQHIETHAERLGPVTDEVLERDGQLIRHYYYRVAYNYRNVARP